MIGWWWTKTINQVRKWCTIRDHYDWWVLRSKDHSKWWVVRPRLNQLCWWLLNIDFLLLSLCMYILGCHLLYVFFYVFRLSKKIGGWLQDRYFWRGPEGGKDNNERAYTAGAPSGTRTGAAEFQEEVLLASSLADATRHMSKLNRLLVIVSCSKLFFLKAERKNRPSSRREKKK